MHMEHNVKRSRCVKCKQHKDLLTTHCTEISLTDSTKGVYAMTIEEGRVYTEAEMIYQLNFERKADYRHGNWVIGVQSKRSYEDVQSILRNETNYLNILKAQSVILLTDYRETKQVLENINDIVL